MTGRDDKWRAALSDLLSLAAGNPVAVTVAQRLNDAIEDAIFDARTEGYQNGSNDAGAYNSWRNEQGLDL